jgi:uncharacterized protein YcbX
MKVEQLWRYPVKSLRGERIASAEFAAGGVVGDRRYALLDDDPESLRRGKLVGGRQMPALIPLPSAGIDFDQIGAKFGRSFAVREATDGSNHDDADVLVASLPTLRALSEEYGKPIDVRRFRANIILDGDDLGPFAELQWPGLRFTVGNVVLEATEPCERCAIPTLDPDTGVAEPPLLRFLAQNHKQSFGMYFKVIAPGSIAEGDAWTSAPS